MKPTQAAGSSVWVALVRGAGRAFCSGIDRTALAEGQIGEPFFRNWARALNCLEDMEKLTVAAVHGYSIGGGLQLAAACDLRVARDDAVLGLGATRHGLIPDGSVLRLARIIGLGRAKELTLHNDHVGAEEARAMGLRELGGVGRDVRDRGGARGGQGLSRLAHRHRPRQGGYSSPPSTPTPRAMGEALWRAQADCLRSWEIEDATGVVTAPSRTRPPAVA